MVGRFIDEWKEKNKAINSAADVMGFANICIKKIYRNNKNQLIKKL